MSNDIRYVVDSVTDKWIHGLTYQGNTLFCKWVKYKLSGNPPTPEQLADTERKRIEKAEEYRKANPREPSKEYFEACKKYPFKDPVKQAEWEQKYSKYLKDK
jgi:hypothetical protein